MKKRFLSCIIIFVVSTLGHGQNIKLSGEAEIGLITGGPGEILYTKFGHSAIRVKNIGNGVDVLFNYGSFDFEAPNFYLNFSKGKLLFKLAKYSFEKQKISYSKEGDQFLNSS